MRVDDHARVECAVHCLRGLRVEGLDGVGVGLHLGLELRGGLRRSSAQCGQGLLAVIDAGLDLAGEPQAASNVGILGVVGCEAVADIESDAEDSGRVALLVHQGGVDGFPGIGHDRAVVQFDLERISFCSAALERAIGRDGGQFRGGFLAVLFDLRVVVAGEGPVGRVGDVHACGDALAAGVAVALVVDDGEWFVGLRLVPVDGVGEERHVSRSYVLFRCHLSQLSDLATGV